MPRAACSASASCACRTWNWGSRAGPGPRAARTACPSRGVGGPAGLDSTSRSIPSMHLAQHAQRVPRVHAGLGIGAQEPAPRQRAQHDQAGGWGALQAWTVPRAAYPACTSRIMLSMFLVCMQDLELGLKSRARPPGSAHSMPQQRGWGACRPRTVPHTACSASTSCACRTWNWGSRAEPGPQAARTACPGRGVGGPAGLDSTSRSIPSMHLAQHAQHVPRVHAGLRIGAQEPAPGLRAQHAPAEELGGLQASDIASRSMLTLASHFLGSEHLQLPDSLSSPSSWSG